VADVVYVPFLNYLRIATAAHARMVDYIKEKGAACCSGDDFSETADGFASIVVIYTAISLECYIHNYASRNLGEKYCKTHVDSMGLHTKWLVVPRLVTGKSIPVDHKGIELLQKLVKARNDTVHLKAANLKLDHWDEQTTRIDEHNRRVLRAAMKAFRCVGLLGRELASLDPGEELAKLLASFTESPDYSVEWVPDERDTDNGGGESGHR